MEKVQKFYDEIMEILAVAEDNKLISLKVREILENNITEAKEEIEKKQ